MLVELLPKKTSLKATSLTGNWLVPNYKGTAPEKIPVDYVALDGLLGLRKLYCGDIRGASLELQDAAIQRPQYGHLWAEKCLTLGLRIAASNIYTELAGRAAKIAGSISGGFFEPLLPDACFPGAAYLPRWENLLNAVCARAFGRTHEQIDWWRGTWKLDDRQTKAKTVWNQHCFSDWREAAQQYSNAFGHSRRDGVYFLFALTQFESWRINCYFQDLDLGARSLLCKTIGEARRAEGEDLKFIQQLDALESRLDDLFSQSRMRNWTEGFERLSAEGNFCKTWRVSVSEGPQASCRPWPATRLPKLLLPVSWPDDRGGKTQTNILIQALNDQMFAGWPIDHVRFPKKTATAQNFQKSKLRKETTSFSEPAGPPA